MDYYWIPDWLLMDYLWIDKWGSLAVVMCAVVTVVGVRGDGERTTHYSLPLPLLAPHC